MTIGFGDAEPEDAWDPDDPLDVLVDNVARRLGLLAVAAAAGELGRAANVRRIELAADDLYHIVERLHLEADW